MVYHLQRCICVHSFPRAPFQKSIGDLWSSPHLLFPAIGSCMQVHVPAAPPPLPLRASLVLTAEATGRPFTPRAPGPCARDREPSEDVTSSETRPNPEPYPEPPILSRTLPSTADPYPEPPTLSPEPEPPVLNAGPPPRQVLQPGDSFGGPSHCGADCTAVAGVGSVLLCTRSWRAVLEPAPSAALARAGSFSPRGKVPPRDGADAPATAPPIPQQGSLRALLAKGAGARSAVGPPGGPVRRAAVRGGRASRRRGTGQVEARQLARMLEEVSFFASVNRPQAALLIGAARFCKFSPGDALVRQGAPAESLYVIVNGPRRAELTDFGQPDERLFIRTTARDGAARRLPPPPLPVLTGQVSSLPSY